MNMGCDIHFYVEIKKDEKWVSADKWSADPYDCGDLEDIGIKWDDRFYTGRNYDLFAMLANVRNGRGFAGVPTGTGFIPIAEPRGLPEDASPEVKAISDRWNGDGHSHSWLTLAELLAYDWNQTTKHTGLVNLISFAEFMTKGKPPAWCGMVAGKYIKHISNEEMAERVALSQSSIAGYLEAASEYEKAATSPEMESGPRALTALEAMFKCDKETEASDGFSYYTRIYWHETYADAAGDFLDKYLPKLQALGKPEEVRIVFFFDN